MISFLWVSSFGTQHAHVCDRIGSVFFRASLFLLPSTFSEKTFSLAILDNTLPIRPKQLGYQSEMKELMIRCVRRLLKLGMVNKVTSPEWVSATLLVPKQPPKMYRITVDCISVNKATLHTFWPMHNIQDNLVDCLRSERIWLHRLLQRVIKSTTACGHPTAV